MENEMEAKAGNKFCNTAAEIAASSYCSITT